jgi:hypothetical protein
VSPRTRRLAEGTLVVLATLACVITLLVAYVDRVGLDSGQFADHAALALRNPSVKTLIADRLTDEVILRRQADLLTARPIIASVTAQVVGGRAFGAIFRAAVRDVHRAVFTQDQHTITLTLVDVGTVIAAGLDVVRPGLAASVRGDTRIALVRRHLDAVTAEVADVTSAAHLIVWLALGLTVLLAAAALLLAADRRRMVARLGAGLAVGGVAIVVAYGILRGVVIGQAVTADGRAAAGAVWDAFLGGLRTAGWVLAGAGAVVAASASSLLRPVDFGGPVRRTWTWVATEPITPPWRVARGGALVALGILVIAERDAVVSLAVTALGVYLVYEGVTAVQQLIYRPRESAAAERRRPALSRRMAAFVLGGALVAIAVSAFIGSEGITAPSPRPGPCDGHQSLCDRPFNEVAFPATHNAMSAGPGWFASQQDHPIAVQLDAGIRGLLIDTYYADRLRDGRLRTDVSSLTKFKSKAENEGVSPQAVKAALRIRDRLGFSGEGTRGMYLCHGFCELGGTPLGPVLDDIHDFLAANPDQVLTIINEDYVAPAGFVAAVDKAGLSQWAYRGPVNGTWPTLREMIDSGHRLVIFAENEAGSAPWYRLAYQSALQETPYSFSRASQLTDPADLAASCAANRGTATAPLMLVNNWISTDPLPLPSNAARVNAYTPLVARLRECERIRGRMPNLVAVDFYARGNVFRAIDTNNGVSGSG